MKSRLALLFLLAGSLIGAEPIKETVVIGKTTYPLYRAVSPIKSIPPNPMPGNGRERGGTVVLHVLVSAQGDVEKVIIKQSDAGSSYRAAAVTAVEARKYPVMEESGKAIPYVTVASMSFASEVTPARTAKPELGKIITDLSRFRSALGKKAILLPNPNTGQVEKFVTDAVHSTGLDQEVEFLTLPTGSTFPEAIKLQGPVDVKRFARSGIPAQALFLMVIGADGTVSGLYCVKSDHPDLAVACAAAIVGWRYTPAKIQGTPVPVVTAQLMEVSGN